MTLLPRPSKRQLIALGIAAVVGLTVLVVRSIQLYNSYGRYVIITSGFEGHFWMGSRSDGQWHGIPEFEKERQDLQRRYGGRDAYIEDALNTIAADPLAYARLLFVKLTGAYLQPQGTVSFGNEGESLKDLALQVLNKKMSLNDLIQSSGFFSKIDHLHFSLHWIDRWTHRHHPHAPRLAQGAAVDSTHRLLHHRLHLAHYHPALPFTDHAALHDLRRIHFRTPSRLTRHASLMIVAHVFKATGLSGSESHLLSLARGLRDEGFESHLIILIDPTRLPDTLIRAAQTQGTPTHLVQLNHDLDLFPFPK